MEVYTIPDHGLADAFLIQGTETNPQFIGNLEQFETMYDEGSQEYIIDQGLYYPTASNYGYICTGLESTGDFEDPAMLFGVDGQDVHYTAGTNETPYVYYPTNYGYGQSPYNPYNPYIPGAIIGIDGSYVAPQQYYTLSYENNVSSPAYMPMILQSGPDIAANGMADSSVYNTDSIHQVNGYAEHNLFSSYPNSYHNMLVNSASRRHPFARVPEGVSSISGSTKQSLPVINPGNFSNQGSSQLRRARVPQDTGNVLVNGKVSSSSGNIKVSLPSSANGLSGFGSRENTLASLHKVGPKLHYARVAEVNGSSATLGEQNRGPRTNKFKNQLVVKAYTSRAGSPDASGNITIYMDQYNRADFSVEAYKNAKFFVIKSYSEDDVHKSIKYNVWSSTPNGNKKLSSAYEDAQRISSGGVRGCPVFLFFSVNASGQFCGVAEMVGPVDFHRDMDFWQQDKWSGSFPVKWHIIKDLPNSNLRHIILENNENKSVTNSRDTQEICYPKGLEMLRICKNYALKTSLLDDFMYYENRQRILQEERVRLLIKSYENPSIISAVDAPRKFISMRDFPFVGDKIVGMQEVKNVAAIRQNDSSGGELKISENQSVATREVPEDTKDFDIRNVAVISKIDSAGGELKFSDNQFVASRGVQEDTKVNNLTAVNANIGVAADELPNAVTDLKHSTPVISSKEPDSTSKKPDSTSKKPVSSTTTTSEIVTIGSMPVKVKGNELSDVLTIGTIPLPRADLRNQTI